MEDHNKRLEIGGNNPPISEVLADTQKSLIERIEPLAERANAMPRKIEDDETLGKVGDLVVDALKLITDLDNARKVEKQPYLDGGREVDSFFKTASERVERISDVFQKIAGDYQREKAAEARRKAEDEARKLREDEARKRQEADNAKRQSTTDRKHDEADEIAAKAEEAEAKAASTNHELSKVKTETGVTAGSRSTWKARIVDYDALPLGPLLNFFNEADVLKAANSMAKAHKSRAKCPGIEFFEETTATFRR